MQKLPQREVFNSNSPLSSGIRYIMTNIAPSIYSSTMRAQIAFIPAFSRNGGITGNKNLSLIDVLGCTSLCTFYTFGDHLKIQCRLQRRSPDQVIARQAVCEYPEQNPVKLDGIDRKARHRKAKRQLHQTLNWCTPSSKLLNNRQSTIIHQAARQFNIYRVTKIEFLENLFRR